MKCCICGKEFEGYGNNPYPFAQNIEDDVRCCDVCNSVHVIPARLTELTVKEACLRANTAYDNYMEDIEAMNEQIEGVLNNEDID